MFIRVNVITITGNDDWESITGIESIKKLTDRLTVMHHSWLCVTHDLSTLWFHPGGPVELDIK